MTNVEQSYPRLGPGAQWYAAQGWKVLPIHGIREDGRCTCGTPHTDPKDLGKHPAIGEWQNKSSNDPLTVENWWTSEPRYNIGVMCRASGFLVVDVDPRSGGFESLEKFENMNLGILPPTVEAVTGEYRHNGKLVRGRHLYYKVDAAENLIGNLKALGLPGVDIKHNGYVLLSPSNHQSGMQYEWLEGHAPWEMEMLDANEVLLGEIRKGRGGSGRYNPSRMQESNWNWIDDLEFQGEKLDVDRFMAEGIDEGSRAVDVFALACSLANKFGTNDVGREAVMATMQKFNAEKVRPPLEWEGQNSLTMHVNRAIDFVAANPKQEKMGSLGGPSLQHRAAWTEQQKAVQTNRREQTEYSGHTAHYERAINTSDPDNWDNIPATGMFDVPKDPDALSVEDGGDEDRRSLTDLGNGRRLVDRYKDMLKYTPGLGWFFWSGSHWRPDTEELTVRESAKRLPSFIGHEVVHYEDNDQVNRVIKWADATKANAKQNAAIDSATSDPRVFVAVDDWDHDPTLFGSLNGVIDLRTGELLKGRPDLHITKRSPVAYTPGLRNPRWERFLDYATGGDKEYQAWLQRAAGYTLTGLRTHDVMFMVYGPGGTGKNVFVEAIVKAMGSKDYAWPMDSQILAQGDGNASSADLYHWAELRGRRMAWVDELPESERLKENSVKKLTGSSEISARSPGEKPFTFESQAKLWVTTNHRPIITDDAMWRRIRPMPWMNQPEKPDPGLKEYIFDPEGGLPAVLAWAVEGAREILNSKESDSLGWCKVVSDAAEMYRKNEDRMGKFIEEETVEAPGKTLPVDMLFSVYEAWSSKRSEKPMSRIAFDRKLMDRRIPIEGTGRNEVLMDRDLRPAEGLPSNDGFDWDMLQRMAK